MAKRSNVLLPMQFTLEPPQVWIPVMEKSSSITIRRIKPSQNWKESQDQAKYFLYALNTKKELHYVDL